MYPISGVFLPAVWTGSGRICYNVLRFQSERGVFMPPVLYIIVPCYNEQEVISITAPRFLKKLKQLIREGKIADNSRILFVDDGSKDKTWEIMSSRLSVPEIGRASCRERV